MPFLTQEDLDYRLDVAEGHYRRKKLSTAENKAAFERALRAYQKPVNPYGEGFRRAMLRYVEQRA